MKALPRRAKLESKYKKNITKSQNQTNMESKQNKTNTHNKTNPEVKLYQDEEVDGEQEILDCAGHATLHLEVSDLLSFFFK